MKLHILSDLHCEFSQYLPHPASNDADVIVLPGDIWKGAMGIYWARKQWPNREIVYVLGNHEFYGFQRKNVLVECRQAAIESGVHFLDDDEIMIDGVRFLGSTLWTDFRLFGIKQKKQCMNEGWQNLNDFRLIREGPGSFSPDDALDLHKSCVTWLEHKLKVETFVGKTVVVTHHLPSKRSCAQRFLEGGSLLSACFASNLDHLLGHSELWIHGHTHDSFDYLADGTRVVCNPRGYTFRSGQIENEQFNPSLILEI